MLNWSLLQSILIIAIACSSVTVIFIQKTKRFCGNSKQIPVYSLIVNMILGFLFSQTFSDISYINSLWVGLFSFLGADTIYKSLEGNLATYEDLIGENNDIPTKVEEDLTNDVIDNNDQTIDNNEIIGEITYE